MFSSFNRVEILADNLRHNFQIFSQNAPEKAIFPIKCNTGMNRQGFDFSDLAEVFEILHRSPHLTVGGIFSHFADADNLDDTFTKRQNEVFSKFLDAVFSEKISPQWIHLGNSAGVLKTHDPRINATRTGIGLYGINPLEPDDEYFSKFQKLKPVLRALSTITNIRTLEAGEAVSYNGTFVAPQKMRVGVVPFGYYEGLDRGLSNTECFKIGNRVANILGRICMNLTVFEVSENEKIGDEVVILSEDPNDPNSAEKRAKAIGTIPYEVFTRISPFLSRKVIF